MELRPQSTFDQLATNGHANQARTLAGEDTINSHPVVRFFTNDGSATWLLSATDPEDADIAFALCDLGLVCAELRSVRPEGA